MSLLNSSITQPVVKTSVSRKVRIDGREQTRQVVLPAHQAGGSIHFPQRRTLNVDYPNNAFSNNGQKFTCQIRRNDINKISHMKAKIELDVAVAASVVNPITHIFDEIDMRTAGNNQLVCSTTSDVMLANILSKTSKGRQAAVFKDLNLEWKEAGYLGCTNPLPIGKHTFYLPLYFSGFFENFDLYLGDSKSDLNFDFHPAQSGIVVSGGGTVTMTNFQFIVENDELTEDDRTAYKNMYSQYLRENRFVDPVLTRQATQTMTAGATTRIDMSNVTGLVSHHLITIKATGSSNVGNTRMRYLNIGDIEGATLDLVDPAQKSLFGAGSAVPVQYLRNSSIDSMDSDWIQNKPMYILSYADNFARSLSGVIDGVRQFTGARDSIAITLPAAPVAEVQTLTPSAAVTAGSYRFLFRGQMSAEIAHDASTAVMAATFNAMRVAAADFITATFSQALSAGAAVATFVHPQSSGLRGDKLEIVGNGLGASVATVITTSGTAGLASGTYDVSIWSFVFRTGSYVNGSLRSDQLAL